MLYWVSDCSLSFRLPALFQKRGVIPEAKSGGTSGLSQTHLTEKKTYGEIALQVPGMVEYSKDNITSDFLIDKTMDNRDNGQSYDFKSAAAAV
ncbi:hypothetical protein scyTo_0000277 [Scyliorhinus torazame]|uniref:Uncharacterized protein n=1 Tax=Scyliorhinus torazame TaxID=75743 RepID=A0A401NU93_SCYTO|nr:hypothetical protein [Scyliorhinus torazame]